MSPRSPPEKAAERHADPRERRKSSLPEMTTKFTNTNLTIKLCLILTKTTTKWPKKYEAEIKRPKSEIFKTRFESVLRFIYLFAGLVPHCRTLNPARQQFFKSTLIVKYILLILNHGSPFKFRSPVTDTFEELAKIYVTSDRYEKWQKARQDSLRS